MAHDLIVVGAGVAGLSLARELNSAGRRVLVLERSRGVGGRCATRRLEGQPVDHGLPFLHGRDARFVADMAAARDSDAAGGWPGVRRGDGAACRPSAFEPGAERLAPRGGVSRFAKHLARDLDVRLGANVTALRPLSAGAAGRPGGWEVSLASGETLRARSVAIAAPVPSAAALLATASPPAAAASILPLLGLVRMLPCLAVIARYPAGAPAPEWQASLPAGGNVLQALLHDSSKRAPGARLVLVLQARPRYSREHLDAPPGQWARALLAEAARLHGAWIAAPETVQAHAWRLARVAEGTELAGPVAVAPAGGGWLGICGDGLHAAGGVEGAWHSGRALAARWLADDPVHA